MWREGETQQGSTQRRKAKCETRLLLRIKHVLDGNYLIRPRRIISPLKNVFGGDQICNDEYTSKNSKNVDFDCIMKAFFDERNYSKLNVVLKGVQQLP